MNGIDSWKLALIGALVITFLFGCEKAPQETYPLEVSSTASPPTSTTLPPTSTLIPPTTTLIPSTRTPFPASCAPSDPSILDVLDAFVVLANAKNVEGTIELFAENGVLDESFRGYHLEGTEEIAPLWRGYYRSSPPCEFRDVAACGNTVTFIWADLFGGNNTLWPVVIEINDGKITYMDYYQKSTIEFPE